MYGGCEVFAVGGVEDVQHAVAGDEVHRPAALRVGRTDDRRVAAAARTQEAELPRTARRRPGAAGCAGA